ncbi:hypothetical protein V5O48_003947 [Marasmius crinis-equi]|uniref:Uncharacterized protein n=1 Tax=Marasmius crinis-equi TaxID=585013 RepID=A0ABR3FRT4_9AGAR
MSSNDPPFIIHLPSSLGIHRDIPVLDGLSPADSDDPNNDTELAYHTRPPALFMTQLLPGDVMLSEPPVFHLEEIPTTPLSIDNTRLPSAVCTVSTDSRVNAHGEKKKKPSVSLNSDVIAEVLFHFLDMEGPHGNTYRVLMLSRAATYKFYREVYITHPKSLKLVKDAVSKNSALNTHVRTLHFGMSMTSPFTIFRPITGELAKFTTSEPLTMQNWPAIREVVEKCRDGVESLAFAGAIVTDTYVQPLLVHTFTSITELGAPVQFIYTPNSPLMTRTSYSSDNRIVDTTWPNLVTLSISVSDPTDFLNHMDLRMDLRHLAKLERLHILFRFLDSECVSRYLRNTKVLPSVQCIAVEMAKPAPSFPLYNFVTDAYFFDPRVVFVHKGPITAPFDRLIKIYARQQYQAIYDLMLVLDSVQGEWEPVLEKVEERRLFAARHDWVYPEGVGNIVQVNAGPFLLSLMDQVETPWPDDEYTSPIPIEAITFDVYHSWI